jgi:hypothetical protein
MPIFDYLETRPEYAEVFNRGMTGVSSMRLKAYAVHTISATER